MGDPTTPAPDALLAVTPRDREAVRAVSERLLFRMREWAKPMGWAVAVHGSMARDLDVIAVPWTDDASDETAFVEAMRAAIASELRGRCFVGERTGKPWPGLPFLKPHGRRSWTLHAIADDLVVTDAGAHPYVDLCVMDRRAADQRGGVEALRDAAESVLQLLTPDGNSWKGNEPGWQRDAWAMLDAALATPAAPELRVGERQAAALIRYIAGLPRDLRWTPEFTRYVDEEADSIDAALAARPLPGEGK